MVVFPADGSRVRSKEGVGARGRDRRTNAGTQCLGGGRAQNMLLVHVSERSTRATGAAHALMIPDEKCGLVGRGGTAERLKQLLRGVVLTGVNC